MPAIFEPLELDEMRRKRGRNVGLAFDRQHRIVVAAEHQGRTLDAVKIAELVRLNEAIERAVADNDTAGIYANDLAFHDALCRLSGNGRLHEVFVRYVPALRALLRLDKRIHGPLEHVGDVHRPIVEAIEAGDGR